MSLIKNKIDFAVVFTVDNANPNGDPLNGNRPRINFDGRGEVSDVCIKRKIRNRWQDMGLRIFVQSDDKRTDEAESLKDRADPLIRSAGKDPKKFEDSACKEWIDVRSFGQVFAFKGEDAKKKDGISRGIRGPVSIRPAFSVSKISIASTRITKSVNSETGEKKSSDTMGMKYRVEYGTYVFYGSINPQLATKTGFSDDDALSLKEALKTLFQNDSSSARPEGSMDVKQVYWWAHNCPVGQHSSAKVHGSLSVAPDASNTKNVIIDLKELEGLAPEIYNC
jgi:CRISPR-associated protein Csd2